MLNFYLCNKDILIFWKVSIVVYYFYDISMVKWFLGMINIVNVCLLVVLLLRCDVKCVD